MELARLLSPYSDESYTRRYCRPCQEILRILDRVLADASGRVFHDPAIGRSIKLGTFGALRKKKGCGVCQAICDGVLQLNRNLPRNEGLFFDLGNGIPQIHVGKRFSEFQHLWLYHSSHAFPQKFVDRKPYIGRKYNSLKIDFGLIRHWVDQCESSHTGCCDTATTAKSTLHELLLIDLHRACLVSLPITTRFVALSYVWGGANTTKANKSNIPFLKTPGSITAQSGIVIPRTIWDAMCLVKRLGERYLWVDCFCIIQNECAAKKLYLDSMGSIFAHAWLTIVAAEGQDANWGLRRIGDDEQNRSGASSSSFPINTHQQIIVDRGIGDATTNSPWATRGWTYQEGIFSRRSLIFNGLISWSCRGANWEEHVKGPSEDQLIMAMPSVSGPKYLTDGFLWPNTICYEHCVSQFGDRKLTYDSDILDAFAGIQASFAPGLGGSFIWGIPELYFDLCITWKPFTSLRRRIWKDRSGRNKLPSWSWVGWEGSVRLGMHQMPEVHPCNDYKEIEVHPLLKPLIRSGTENASMLHKSRVKNDWYHLQRAFRDTRDTAVPDGWRREAYPEPYQNYVQYTHPRLPPGIRLRYPVPLASDPNSNVHFESVLEFRAKRAWLFIGEKLEEERGARTSCSVTLNGEGGIWAGSLCLHSSRFEAVPMSHRCELVALSFGRKRETEAGSHLFEEWHHPMRPKDAEFYEYYNVVWIEWEDGVASRKAIGRVHRPVWEAIPLEEIEVLLG